MFDGADVIYTYDGSFEGLLSAVFEAYASALAPSKIASRDAFQPTFGAAIMPVATDEARALRVTDGIRRKLGAEAYQTVLSVFLSEDEDRSTKIYRYLAYGFRAGRGFTSHLAHPDVLAANDIARAVGRECNAIIEFVRFAQMDNGVFFSRIHPKNCVIPLIMDHFAQRYNIQPFIIYDEAHHLAGVYDTQAWYMTPTQHLRLGAFAPGEAQYRQLWQAFYDAIAIKERVNPNLRRSHMPKRFWRDMLELNDSRLVEQHAAIKDAPAAIRPPLYELPKADAHDNDI